ncbi:MAG TPA: hypothetical protein VGM37_11280 [Armatimonadota bacterium]|jgi:hypothetical protein
MAEQRKLKEARATALFFAETRNRKEIEELAALAEDLTPHGKIRLISEGIITAYAVQLPASGLPLLSALETTLKRHFVFGHVELPFQETISRVVEELALDTSSRLIPVEHCEMCRAPEPFPASVRVMGEDGKTRRTRSTYCASCAASMMARASAAPAATEAKPIPQPKPNQQLVKA